MGACGTKLAMPPNSEKESAVHDEDVVLDQQAQQKSGGGQAPKVMVFAVMRNGHEGVRGLLLTLVDASRAAVETPNTANAQAVASAWKALREFIDVHMRTENELFFPLLDSQFDGVVTKEGLLDEHVSDSKEQAELTAVIDALVANPSAESAAAAKAKVEEFHKHHLKHLEHEEKVMMPLARKLEPKAARPAMVHKLLTLDFEGYLHKIISPNVREMGNRNPYPSTRMLVWALQRSLTAEEYAKVIPVVKEAAGAELWEKLAADGCGNPGKLSQEEIDTYEKATAPAKKAEAKSGGGKGPNVMVFAVMRNGHEGVRGLLLTLVDAAAAATGSPKAANAQAVASAWKELREFIDVHMRTENELFFPLLDSQFDGVVTKEGLLDEHVSDSKEQAELTAVIDALVANPSAESAAAAKAKVEEFHKHHLKHLEHEEKVMMPLARKLEPKAARPAMVHKLLTLDFEGYLHKIISPNVREMGNRNPYPSTRMLVWALQRSLTAEEYAKVIPVVKEAAGAELWEKLAADGCGNPGKLTQEEIDAYEK